METQIRNRILKHPFSVYASEFGMDHARNNEEAHSEEIIYLLAVDKVYHSWLQILKFVESSDQYPRTNLPGHPLYSRLASLATPVKVAKALNLNLVADV